MIGLPDGQKSFKIGLAVLIQYLHVTNTQPATQPCCRSKDHTHSVLTAIFPGEPGLASKDRVYVYITRVKMIDRIEIRQI